MIVATTFTTSLSQQPYFHLTYLSKCIKRTSFTALNAIQHVVILDFDEWFAMLVSLSHCVEIWHSQYGCEVHSHAIHWYYPSSFYSIGIILT
jgi:hypothetical protein